MKKIVEYSSCDCERPKKRLSIINYNLFILYDVFVEYFFKLNILNPHKNSNSILKNPHTISWMSREYLFFLS